VSIAFAAGAVLALGAAVGGFPGAVLAALAQPAFALAISWWRRSRALLPLKVVARQDLPALLALWTAAPLLLALLLAWPLAALRDSGSLAAVLGLSVLVSAGLVAAWRTWPLWNDVERLDGSLAQHWQALAGRDLGAWRGLGVAALVIALAALVVLPAWPGLLPESAHWPAALAVVLLSPVLHLLLQRVAPAPLVSLRAGPLATASDEREPMFSAAVETTPLEAMAPQELTPALYEAARHGRIDRGLQLLQAGADPYALPDPNSRDQRSLAVLAAVLPDLRLLRELIARGVDVNAPHRGMTPLLAATRDSWHGRPEAVMTLLANGADSRATDSDGNTPLHHAARSSDPGVAALLRDAAAEVDALNNEGWSPLAVACQVGNWRLPVSCSNAVHAANRPMAPRCCWPPPPPRTTIRRACSCCSSTRRGPTRVIASVAARCMKRRWPVTSRSSACCWLPAPIWKRAMRWAVRRGWKRPVPVAPP